MDELNDDAVLQTVEPQDESERVISDLQFYNPTEQEVDPMDEICNLDGFQAFMEERDGENLTFGDM